MKQPHGLIRLLWVAAAVICGLNPSSAQTNTSTGQTKPQAPATQSQNAAPSPQDKVWVKDPNSVMPMRKMTNAEHRAAAQRNRDRQAKADAQRKQNQVNPQSGVQR